MATGQYSECDVCGKARKVYGQLYRLWAPGTSMMEDSPLVEACGSVCLQTWLTAHAGNLQPGFPTTATV